jgi:hypothetical protein
VTGVWLCHGGLCARDAAGEVLALPGEVELCQGGLLVILELGEVLPLTGEVEDCHGSCAEAVVPGSLALLVLACAVLTCRKQQGVGRYDQ